MTHQRDIMNNRYGQTAQYNFNPCTKETLAHETESDIFNESLPIKFTYGSHASTSGKGDIRRAISPTRNIKQIQFGMEDQELYNRNIYSGATSSFVLGIEPCIESNSYDPSSVHSSNSPNKQRVYKMPEMTKAGSYTYSTEPMNMRNANATHNMMHKDVKANPQQVVELQSNKMRQYIKNNPSTQDNRMKQMVSIDMVKNALINTPITYEEIKTSDPLKMKTNCVSDGSHITRDFSESFKKASAENSFTFNNSKSFKRSKFIKKQKYKIKTKSGKLFYEAIDENTFSEHKKNGKNENNKYNNSNDNNISENNKVSNLHDYVINPEDNLNKEQELKKGGELKKKNIIEEQYNSCNKYTDKLKKNPNNFVKREDKHEKNSPKKNFEQTNDAMISKKEESKKNKIRKSSPLINDKGTERVLSDVESSQRQLPNILLPSINKNIINENGGLTLFEKFIIIDKYDGIKHWTGFEWERITNDHMFFLKVKYDLKGSIWCINDSHELLKIVDGKIKNLGILGNEKIIDIGFDKNNILWSVNIKGQLLKWNKTEWRKFSYSGFHKLISLSFDLEGNLWAINCKRTVAVWNPNKKNWDEKIIKNNKKILHMDFDENGMIWALTTTNSLLSYYSGNWINHGISCPSQIISFSCKRS